MRDRFRALHADGLFVMPNPWDIGSAVILARMGFTALATTSSGHAASLGRTDQHVTRDELVHHADVIAGAVDVPVNIDAERCFIDDPGGITETIRMIGQTGAAGVSIEDFDPSRGIIAFGEAVEHVTEAAEAARECGLVLTARAENHIYGVEDLDDTVARLTAFLDAGAEVLYAPGLREAADIARVIDATEAPINVLARADGPSIHALGQLGVRRVSTGGALAKAAYASLMAGATDLLDSAAAGPSPDRRERFDPWKFLA